MLKTPDSRDSVLRRKIEREASDQKGGAYGFRLVTPEGHTFPDLSPVATDAETVTLDWRYASALMSREVVAEDRAEMSLERWGLMDVRRAPPAVVCSMPEIATPAAIVHPLSTVPLALLSHWRGRLTLHGGAFLHGGRAWLVVGEQMAGKSTTLVALAQRGVPVLADDLIVIDDGVLLAGPRCVDLRPDVAARVSGSRSLGVVAGRERHRMSTPGGPPRVPVGGLFALEWGGDAALDVMEMTLEERLRVMYTQHYAGTIGPPHEEQLMAMFTLPAWRARRRRDWFATDDVLDQLLERAA